MLRVIIFYCFSFVLCADVLYYWVVLFCVLLCCTASLYMDVVCHCVVMDTLKSD